MKFVLFFLMVFGVSSAHATGGYWCEIKDANVNMEISGVLSRSIPDLPISTSGQLEFVKAEHQRFNMSEIKKVSNFWAYKGVLNVMVYNENYPGEHTPMTFVIETKYDSKSEDGAFVGTYTVYISRPASTGTVDELEGNVTCWME